MRVEDRRVHGMVLAAGLGTRLRPLTDLVPKPLVPVLGVPVVESALDLLERAGASRIVVNLHHLGAVLGDALRAAGPRRFTLELVEEPRILGTGGGLKNAERWLAGADAIVLMNGDTWLDLDLAAMVRDHLESGAAATLAVRPNPDPRRFPPVETDAELRVRRIAGLPAGAAPGDPWLFAGVHVLDPGCFAHLPAGEACDVNRTLHPALLARGANVRAWPFSGAWSDVGTPRRLLEANLAALAGPPPATLRLAAARGYRLAGGSLCPAAPAWPGDVRLEGSVVGHGADLGPGASIDRSVVFPGAGIGPGARVRSSLIGPLASIAAGETVERVLAVGSWRLPLEGPDGGEGER